MEEKYTTKKNKVNMINVIAIPPSLNQDDIILIEEYNKYLEGFVISALQKFIRGRVEHHSQAFSSIDYEKEIENELYDVTAYNFGRILANKQK